MHPQGRRHPDCVYIAASALDGRLTRICVASVRHFYPDIPIRILVGGPLEKGLADELERYWGITPANLPRGDYGWGFVKLEVLFGPPGETFLVLDSDTIMAGPVISAWTHSDAPFVVDDEQQSEVDTKRIYFDWMLAKEVDPDASAPDFVFNSGQWFGTAGLLTRDDFDDVIEWGMPPRLRRPDCFKNGDQGALNYVLNRKARAGLAVDRRKIMLWPGHSLDGIGLQAVAAGNAPPVVIHWAGLKRRRISAMKHPELLAFFEREYYRRMPLGRLRQIGAGCRDVTRKWFNDLRSKVRGRLRSPPGGRSNVHA